MTRPKEKTFAVGNYAPGPAWGNLPKRLAPSGNEFVPNTGTGARVQNFMYGDLYDGVNAAVRMQGQDPALNYMAGVRGTNTNGMKRLVWGQFDQLWLACGDGGNTWVEVTLDHGRTWTNLAATIGTALVELDVAIDGAGNAVTLASGSRDSHEGARTAYGTWTWTKTTNAFSANPSAGMLEYEPTNNKLVAVYRVGATGMRIDGHASPIAGTAWTARTIPATWTNYTGTLSPVVGAGGGTLVAAFPDAGAQKINVIASTDGGATWSANVQISSQALTAGYGGIDMGRPTYDAANGDWFIVLASTTGTTSTEIFRSSDGGATWTSVFYRTASIAFYEVQALGSLLVATNQDGQLSHSTDRGVTWKRDGAILGSAARVTLRAGGGGLLFSNAADKITVVTPRFGDPGRVL